MKAVSKSGHLILVLAAIASVQARARSFTTGISEEGQSFLATNFQFLCTLKTAEGSAAITALEQVVLSQASRPEDTIHDKIVQKLLTESIITSALAACDREEILHDQPGKTSRQSSDTTYVENILQNVFSGNLIGVIQTHVGGPSRVTSSTTDIFRSLLTSITSMRTMVSLPTLPWSGSNATTTRTPTKSKVTTTEEPDVDPDDYPTTKKSYWSYFF